MKSLLKIVLFIGMVLSATGCGNSYYNTITHYSDEFKKTETFILNQRFTPDEEMSLINSALITYEKQKRVPADKVTLFFVFERNAISFNIDKKGFIKTSGHNFEVAGVNLTTENYTQTVVTNNNVITLDSTGVKSIAGNSSETKSWLQDKFKLELSEEIVQALRNGNDLTFRFYTNWRAVIKFLQ
jgi:hypothetical protein